MNLSLEQLLLLFNIHNGNLLPVNKLINSSELDMILDEYSFNNKTYSLPYIFFVDKEYGSLINCYYNDIYIGKIEVESYFKINLIDTCYKIFNTIDKKHVGVKKFLDNDDKLCLSGYIKEFNYEILKSLNIPYMIYSGNKSIVFQSRNPAHKAHESIINKYAPNMIYTTPYSTSKSTDYSFELKIKVYEVVKEKYGIDLFVTTLPRVFAGSREALQNCLIFQNMKAEEFIMGRGKNCVGDFYGDTESYDFCKKMYDKGKITIKPIWQDTMYDSSEIEIKASIIKQTYIDKKIIPPNELMSEYIARILIDG